MGTMKEQGKVIAGILALAPVIPVLVFRDAAHAVPTARALVRGGLRVLEVTLRTPAAGEALRRIAAEVPEAVVGAGTVLQASQLEAAKAAGARFCVSPGFTAGLLAAARGEGMPLLPGACTPAECMALLDAGHRHQKFFPAEAAGGIALLKALAAPLPEVVFCPTGGIDPAGARDYLALPNVACVGGSWLAPAEALAAGDWGRVEASAREASALRG